MIKYTKYVDELTYNRTFRTILEIYDRFRIILYLPAKSILY